MNWFNRLPLMGKIGIGAAAGMLVCCSGLSVLTAIFPSDRVTPEATATQAAKQTQAPETAAPTIAPPTPTVAATAKPPTATRRPTETEPPTSTPTDVPPTPTKARARVIQPTAAPQPTQASVQQPTAEPPTQAPAQPTAAPTQAPVPALTVVEFRSPVPAGGNARVVIQTSPGAACYLTYYTPSGKVSEATGLGAATADGNGICAWEWKIGSQTNPGQGTVVIQAGDVVQRLPIEIQ